jgi:hypothetical protein
MTRLLVFLLSLGLVSLVVAPTASATTTITGTATSCSGLGACRFTLNGSAGSGWATTFGGSISFQLPGEVQATSYQPYAITWVVSGSLYQVTGTINALDATTGTIVTGSTSVTESKSTHCFRSCSVTWKLVSGSITIQQTTQRRSTTTLTCSPNIVYPGGASTCVVTLTDPGAVGASTPTGGVTFSQSPSGSGVFSPAASCTLASGTCSVTLTTSISALNGVAVTAAYAGDGVHIGSSASQTIVINEDS